MDQLTILIGDDHTLVRQAITRILEDHEGWRVVGAAGDGREVVRLTLELQPDVVILDVAMPHLNGMEAATEIAQRAPSVKVLMLSMHSEPDCISRALRTGARGYLLKDSCDTDLVEAVTAVAAGQSFFSPAVASVMRNDYVRRLAQTRNSDDLDSLSAREREVFQLVAEGQTNRMIAERLRIRPATVETHRSRILQKLDIHNTAQLVRLAFRHNVIA